jgi:paraquat-inducible protein B
MSKGASKTVIGGFVIGALALMVVAVLIFGSGKFFSRKIKGVMFFEESVSGLNVGAPVVFRGVTVGSVVAINLWNFPKLLKVLIPVYIEINPDEFKSFGEETRVVNLPRQIKQGLRAQLKVQSLVTGQLMIYMDYFPDKPVRLVGAEKRYPEVPTIPSGTEALLKALEKIPLQEIALKTAKAIEGIERLINSTETGEVVKNLNTTLKGFQKVAGKLDGAVDEFGQGLKDVRVLVRRVDAQVDPLVAEARGALGDAQTLLKDADREVVPLAAGLRKTLDEAGGVLGEARLALKKASELISDESILSAEILNSLEELNRTLRSIQLLAEFLKQHPEALITGKRPAGGK